MTDERPGTAADRARWRRYLADERAEAAVYRELAARRDGEEREILLALAQTLAFAASVKGAAPVFHPGHGADLITQVSADLRASARSVFSQEKPPSASGLRPK